MEIKVIWDACFEERARQLGKIEEIVLDAWVAKFAGHFDRIGFNVPLLTSLPGGSDQINQAKPKILDNLNYRIDAIIGNGNEVELIEVKEVGNMTAIGQLLTYRMLYVEQYFGFEKLHLRLVCLRAPEVIKDSCQFHGINVDEMEAEASDQVALVRRRKDLPGG